MDGSADQKKIGHICSKLTFNCVNNNVSTRPKCFCDWSKCANSHPEFFFDLETFWKSCEHHLHHDENNKEKKEKEKELIHLYHMKNISLNNSRENRLCELQMGMSPFHRFAFFSRLRLPASGACVYLNAESLSTLLNLLNDASRLEDGIDIQMLPRCSSSSNHKNRNRPSLQIIWNDIEIMYRIQTKSKCITINQEEVNQMLRLQPFIRKFMENVASKQNEFESNLIQTLYVCSEYGNVNEMCLKQLRKFLIYSLNLQCKCVLIQEFLIEMALYYLDWIQKCIPIFVNVLMKSKN